MITSLNDFELYFEYISDADLERAQEFERNYRAERNRLRRWLYHMRVMITVRSLC